MPWNVYASRELHDKRVPLISTSLLRSNTIVRPAISVLDCSRLHPMIRQRFSTLDLHHQSFCKWMCHRDAYVRPRRGGILYFCEIPNFKCFATHVILSFLGEPLSKNADVRRASPSLNSCRTLCRQSAKRKQTKNILTESLSFSISRQNSATDTLTRRVIANIDTGTVTLLTRLIISDFSGDDPVLAIRTAVFVIELIASRIFSRERFSSRAFLLQDFLSLLKIHHRHIMWNSCCRALYAISNWSR